MGMVAAYQQVPAQTLAKLIARPALLEDFLFPDQDSYGVNGYGDVSVDISASGMSAWEEIHRRVQGLAGEAKLKDGTTVSLRGVELTRETIRWHDPRSAMLQQRPHSEIAALRLLPPLPRRLARVWHRTGEFAVPAMLVALLLSFVCLHLQKARLLPPWGLAALALAFVALLVGKALSSFRRERLVVTYHHRRSRSLARGESEPIDIDKSLEPIETALVGFDHHDAETIRKAVLGGREIAGSEVGFGPARYLSAEEVAALASSFSRVSAEAFAERCTPDLREYVAQHLRNLQGYYRDAAARGHAMIGYFC